MIGIIVAFPRREDAQNIKSILIRNGYEAVTACTTGAQAVQLADSMESGIIISGYRLPDMQCGEVFESVGDYFEKILLTSRDHMEDLDEDAATLELPLKVKDLINTIDMMEDNLYARQHRGRSQKAKRSIAQQAVITKAKEVLMEKHNFSENEAHRYIQKTAMDSGRTMVETADMILMIMYQE